MIGTPLEKKRYEIEESVRKINLEPRINRLELGRLLKDAIDKKVNARMLRPLPGDNHTYVMMPLTDKNWQGKESELKLRCVVARADNPDTEKIIGIAVGSNSNGEEYFDICYLSIPNIDAPFIGEANKIREEFGYFKKLVIGSFPAENKFPNRSL